MSKHQFELVKLEIALGAPFGAATASGKIEFTWAIWLGLLAIGAAAGATALGFLFVPQDVLALDAKNPANVLAREARRLGHARFALRVSVLAVVFAALFVAVLAGDALE